MAAALIVAGLVAFAIIRPGSGHARGVDKLATITVDGQQRSYRLFVPASLPAKKLPLILALHPLGGSPASFEADSDFDDGAADTGTLVAYPAGLAHSWNAGTCCGQAHIRGVDDVAFLDAVIADIEAHYPVDPQRIAIGGFSNGAMMSYRYLCQRADRVHVAFIGSGALMSPGCRFSQPVRVLQFHGLRDTVLPWRPFVTKSLYDVARADGCSGHFQPATIDPAVTRLQATRCPAGGAVVALLSRQLVHGWVTGTDAESKYGIDETHATWSWLATSWSD